jgi:anaerobic selenocysteine-containing dehydrogenase
MLAAIAAVIQTAPNRTAIYVGNGLEHHRNGMENIRTIGFLPAITGAVDTKGGNRIYESPPIPRLTLYDERPLRSLSPIGAQEFPLLYRYVRQCHNIRGLQAMVTGNPYPLRGLIMTAANPALTNPDSHQTRRALAGLDLLVVRDLFMTATAQLAHYFLPAASFFERSELVSHGICNQLGITRKLLSYQDCQDEYQFWHDLAHRLNAGDYFPWDTEEDLNAWLLSETEWTPEFLLSRPEGVTFKPVAYEKWRNQPFATSTGKICFISQEHINLGFPGLPEYTQNQTHLADEEFLLISGARRRLFNHSRNHQIPEFRQADPEAFLTIRADDAQYLNISNGEWVLVTGPVGTLRIRALVCANDSMRERVVTIPHAWEAANVNQIIPDDVLDPLSGFPVLKAVSIRIEGTGTMGAENFHLLSDC